MGSPEGRKSERRLGDSVKPSHGRLAALFGWAGSILYAWETKRKFRAMAAYLRAGKHSQNREGN
jgi:hypothetical protein